MLWDVFISHASEDKAAVARPLAGILGSAGLRVWLDEAELKLGDSLRAKIDEGLAESTFGVVVLSPSFFAKPWPQRELSALFTRSNAILPVWHQVRAADIAAKSPLVADLLAVSTDDGLDVVASEILRAVGRPVQTRVYRSNVALNPDRVERALQVLEHLSKPTTWPHLAIQTSGYPATGWMGSNSTTLVEILYAFAAPIVEYKQRNYDLRRNFALLSKQTRLQVALLDCAARTICGEEILAASDPPLEYTPRVPGWRGKRAANPQRYWWQGISEDRLRDAIPYFLRSNTTDTDDLLVSADEFHATYQRVYAAGDLQRQQTLGLLANGFYGFTPLTRPVLWRVCVTLALLYSAATGHSRFDAESDDAAEAAKLFQPKDPARFPFNYQTTAVLFEPYETTFNAALRYVESTCLRQVRASLNAARENA